MRLTHTFLAAAGALLIAGTAHAQTTTTPRPDRTEQRAKRHEMAANMTPEQKEFAKAMRAERKRIGGEVKAGTLTRDQAKAEMKAWRESHKKPTG